MTSSCPYCELSTGGTHEYNCPNHPRFAINHPSTERGAWICPRCGTVNAPWKDSCNCKDDEENAIVFHDGTKRVCDDCCAARGIEQYTISPNMVSPGPCVFCGKVVQSLSPAWQARGKEE